MGPLRGQQPKAKGFDWQMNLWVPGGQEREAEAGFMVLTKAAARANPRMISFLRMVFS
jgi:hypothetical protein